MKRATYFSLVWLVGGGIVFYLRGPVMASAYGRYNPADVELMRLFVGTVTVSWLLCGAAVLTLWGLVIFYHMVDHRRRAPKAAGHTHPPPAEPSHEHYSITGRRVR